MWPESTVARPKQFLPLVGDKSTLRINYEQVAKFVLREKIWVLTTSDLVPLVKKEIPEVRYENYVIEPDRKNHGPAISLMMARLAQLDENEPFMIVQTDVIREPEVSFREMVMMAEQEVRERGYWLTAGTKAVKRIPGVDYLKVGKSVKYGEVSFWELEKWLGREDLEEIALAVERGRAMIHATHLCWTPKKMIGAISREMPGWGQAINKIISESDELEIIYGQMESGSIEEKVVSRLKEPGFVVEMPFEWFDLGTWESVAEYNQNRSKNGDSRFTRIEIEALGNYVRAPEGKTVAIIGADNLIVVDTPDGLLICRKDLSGKVGEVVKII